MELQLAWPATQLHDQRWAFCFTDQDRTAPPFLYVAVYSVDGSQSPAPECAEWANVLAVVNGATFGQFVGCLSPTEVDPYSGPWIVQELADALPADAPQPGGGLIWPIQIDQPSFALDQALLFERSDDAWSLLPTRNLLVVAEPKSAVELSGPGDVAAGIDALYIGVHIPASLQVGGATASETAQATIDFTSGPTYGDCLVAGTLAADASMLRLGFAFTLASDPSVTRPASEAITSLFYPLFDAAGVAALAGQAAQLHVPVAGPATLTFPSVASPLESGYRTSLGGRVLLSPASGTAMVLSAQYAGDGSLSFTPVGAWQLGGTRLPGQSFDLICGLSGLESLTMKSGDILHFYADQPSLILATPPRGGAGTGSPLPHLRWAPDETSPRWTTAYATPQSGSAGPLYAKHSQAAPLFAVVAAPDGLLEAIDPPGWTLAVPDLSNAFPLLPYGGLSPAADISGADLLIAMESSIIAPKREACILKTAGPPQTPQAAETAVTPQGFLLSFAQGGQLSKVQFAASADGSDAIAIDLTAGSPWASALNEAFGAAQPFVVISVQDSTSGDQVTGGVTLDGWTLDLTLASQAQAVAGAYQTILIIKAAGAPVSHLIANPEIWAGRTTFTESTVDSNGDILSGYLQDLIAQTRFAYAGGAGVADFGAFLEVVDNPAWTGVLVLNAPVDLATCPPDVQAMLIGADRQGGAIVAHHLIATPGRVALDGSTASAASSFDAVIHYLRPGVSLASTYQGDVGMLPSTGSEQFLLLHLRAVFKGAVLKHFASAAALVIPELFGEQVTGGSLDGGLVTGTNAVVVEGVMYRSAGGQPVYGFVAPSSTSSVFYLNSTMLDYVLIDQTSTEITQTAASGTTTTVVTFKLAGWMRTRQFGPFDIASYDAIALSGLAVTMTYALGAAPSGPTFAFDTTSIALSATHESLSCQNAGGTSHVPTGNLYRTGSLVAQWPLRLAQLVLPVAGQTPASLGFQPVSLPAEAPAAPAISDPWLGLMLSLSLGANGMANTPQLLSGQLLLTWPITPAGAGSPPLGVTPFFRLTGPDGMAMQFEVEGVISLGIAAIRLRARDPKAAVPEFILELQGIGLTVLSTTLPMNGGATVYLGGTGDASRALGWYGGVVSAVRS